MRMKKQSHLKLRNMQNMPVFNESNAKVIARVEKAVIDDDYRLAYLIIKFADNDVRGMLDAGEVRITSESVIIDDFARIKSYESGEELSIYERKIGDLVFDMNGKELGEVSDFIINMERKKVSAMEVSAGTISDMLNGRMEIPIAEINWKSVESLVFNEGGNTE